MLLFAEMPVLIVPTAVLLVITVGRVYTVFAERMLDRRHGTDASDSDLNGQRIRHA
ncbi:MAG: hypothetical protein WA154_02905 [Moraxellaceae bacterium]